MFKFWLQLSSAIFDQESMSELVQQLCSGPPASWPLERLAMKLSAWFTGSWSVTKEELQRWEGSASAERMEEAGHQGEWMVHRKAVDDPPWLPSHLLITRYTYLIKYDKIYKVPIHMQWFTLAALLHLCNLQCFYLLLFKFRWPPFLKIWWEWNRPPVLSFI